MIDAAFFLAASTEEAVAYPAGPCAPLASESSLCCCPAVGEKRTSQHSQLCQQSALPAVVSEYHDSLNLSRPCLSELQPKGSCIHEDPCLSELQPKGSCIQEGRPCLWAIVWFVMNLLRNIFKSAKSAASLPTPVFALNFKSEWPFPDALSRCERNPIDIFQCPFCQDYVYSESVPDTSASSVPDTSAFSAGPDQEGGVSSVIQIPKLREIIGMEVFATLSHSFPAACCAA